MAEPSDAELGWLAGLINGEGCFLVVPAARRGDGVMRYSCKMQLALRADEVCVIEKARRIAGNIGRIVKSDKVYGAHKSPIATWTVHRKPECHKLANILLAQNLSGAKAFQFLTWYEALLEWSTVVNGYHDGDDHDWSKMAELHKRLKSLRAYGSTPSCMPELAEEAKTAKEAIG